MLKGALHLTDYITQVMKRLSDESVDPKVVTEFVFFTILLLVIRLLSIDRQTVLNGALHLSDYVAKVMKRLMNQAWIPRSCSSLSFHDTTTSTRTNVYRPHLSRSSVAVYIRFPHQNSPNYLKTKLTQKQIVKTLEKMNTVR